MTTLMADFELPDTMKLRPPRNPVVGNAEFRSAMAAMASTVSVVTARRGDEQIGRTVTSMMSLAINPPTILISIDIMSRLADIIAKTNGFSLAMLADDQQEVGNAFAGGMEPEHRFGVGEWSRWPSGHPMLLGAVTAVDCDVVGAIETGTHVLFAGAIIEVETTTSRSPLIWQRHHYQTLGGLD
ncbi:flavin reductase [Devosia sp. BSSL-BM10]|uniref:Flavin reductase n=1 Tax=Devosia litorisediminis TaxID=2829817 RepID=A0A942IDX0_9HYPH|nr:flavin reductase family protein [Devosia litorisediminis]MBS3849039.1 flavin reductase [Devosia litorisediminis]